MYFSQWCFYSNKSITVSLTSSFFFRVLLCCCYSVLLTNYPFRYRDNCTNYHKKLYLNCFHPTATRHCVCCYLYLVPLKKNEGKKGVSGIKKPYLAAFFGKWVDFLSESKIPGRWLPAKGIFLLQITQMIKTCSKFVLITFYWKTIKEYSIKGLLWKCLPAFSIRFWPLFISVTNIFKAIKIAPI